jgi:hypothetical protein
MVQYTSISDESAELNFTEELYFDRGSFLEIVNKILSNYTAPRLRNYCIVMAKIT